MAPTWIETDVNTNKDIRTAVAVGVYTSTGDKFVMPQLLADQVAGGGDYVYYVTLQVNGTGSHYVIGPKTTHTAAAGETAIGAQGGFIAVRSGDVVTVYIDGSASDETTPDVTVRWFELDASANVTYWAGVAAGAMPAKVADLPAAAPTAAVVRAEIDASSTQLAAIKAKTDNLPSDVLTAAGVTAAVWDAARSGHAGAGTFGATDEWAGSVDEAAIAAAVLAAADSDPISANVTKRAGVDVAAADANGNDPVDTAAIYQAFEANPVPVVLDVTARQQVRDALMLAPTAGAPAVGSVDAHLDALALEATAQAILEDTGETLPGLIAAGVSRGSSTGYYTDTIDDGTNPLDGVRVQLYTAPSRTGLAYEAYTNALGVFEMWPDPGTYYRWLDLAGYNFSQDVAVTVTEP